MVPRVLFKPPAEAARQLVMLLSPPDVPPDPIAQGFFELMLGSQFRSEQLAPRLTDQEPKGLDGPTYLLMGRHEVSFDPYGALERRLRLLPNVISAEIVPGVGHTLNHRQPDWVVSRVMNSVEHHAVDG